MKKNLREVTEIFAHKEAEIAEVLQAVADRREEVLDAVVLVYCRDGHTEIYPTSVPLERGALLLQLFQEHINSMIRRQMTYDESC